MRRRFNVLRISLRAMLVLVALCAIGFRWHREIRRFGRDLLFYPWYRLDDERLDADESGRTFNIVAFSPDGNILSTVGENRGEATLAVWDVAARRLRRESKLPEKNFYDLFLSADGKTAVVINGRESFINDVHAGPSTAIRFDLADGRRRSTTSLGPTPIRGVALSHDGNTLAAGTDETETETETEGESAGKLALWDLRTGAKVAEKQVEGFQVAALAYAPDGSALAMALRKTNQPDAESQRGDWIGLRFLDPKTLRQKGESSDIKGDVDFLIFSEDGSTLLAATNEWSGTTEAGIVRLWDAKTRRVRTSIDNRRDTSSLAIASDGKSIAIDAVDLLLYDGVTGEARSEIRVSSPTSFAFGARGRNLAIAPSDFGNDLPLILDLETGRELDWSTNPFPAQTPAYLAAGIFLLLAATALARLKRRRRAGTDAAIAKVPKGSGRKFVLVGILCALCFGIAVGGVLVWRTICARRLKKAIEVSKLIDDPAVKALLKGFAEQGVYSPRCARLLDYLSRTAEETMPTLVWLRE